MKLEKPQSPQEFNKPKRQILGTDQLDDLGLALISLTREMVVTNDRLALLEHVLASKGIDVSEEINTLEPDADLQKRLDEAAAKVTNAVIGALAGGK